MAQINGPVVVSALVCDWAPLDDRNGDGKDAPMSLGEDWWEHHQQAAKDPYLLLLDVNDQLRTAISMAENSPQEQQAAAIFAQVATAKAIAALAAAVLSDERRTGGPADGPPDSPSGS